MDKQALKIKLKNLEEKKNSPFFKNLLKNFSSDTKEEAENYRRIHYDELKELKSIENEIQAIEWELMTDEEKKRSIEVDKMIREKYKND